MRTSRQRKLSQGSHRWFWLITCRGAVTPYTVAFYKWKLADQIGGFCKETAGKNKTVSVLHDLCMSASAWNSCLLSSFSWVCGKGLMSTGGTTLSPLMLIDWSCFFLLSVQFFFKHFFFLGCGTAMFPTSCNPSILLCRNLTPRNFTTCWRQLKVMRRKVRASSLTSLDTSSASWVSPGILWKVNPPLFTSGMPLFLFLLNLFIHWWWFVCPQKWLSWAVTTAETQKPQKQTTQLMWVKPKHKWELVKSTAQHLLLPQ